LDFFGVYHITPKGQIEAIARWKSRPNGVTLSPDGKILYVANTEEKSIHAFDLDQQGRASHDRIVVASLEAGADGIRTDRKGNLYLAVRGVAVYSPDGRLLGKIHPPVNPRNIAFGDKDFKTLYMIGNALFSVRLDVAGSVQY
jgi:gluconolactonase